MPRISAREYEKLEEQVKALVASDISSAFTRFEKIIQKIDLVFYASIPISIIAILIGGWLSFTGGTNPLPVFGGMILAAIGAVLLLSILGIDPNEKLSPDTPVYLNSIEFPTLFELINSLCDQLNVPRQKHVTISYDRFLFFSPSGGPGKTPTWSLSIGILYLLEASSEEFKWELTQAIARFHGKHHLPFRQIYDRMSRRSVFTSWIPADMNTYWEAYLIANVISHKCDPDANDQAAQVADSSWIGSHVYRVHTGQFLMTTPFHDVHNRWEIELEEFPHDFCRRYLAVRVKSVPHKAELISLLLPENWRSKGNDIQGVAEQLLAAGLPLETINYLGVEALGRRLANLEAESALQKFVELDTDGCRVIDRYVQERLQLHFKFSRKRSILGQKIALEKGVESIDLSADECLSVAHAIGAEQGELAAFRYIGQALNQHPSDLWLVTQYVNMAFHLDPANFPNLISQLNSPSANDYILSYRAAYKSYFPYLEPTWANTIEKFDATQIAGYLESMMHPCEQQYWIEQSRKNPQVGALAIFRAVDKKGTEKEYVVAILKGSAFKLVRPWRADKVRKEFVEMSAVDFFVSDGDVQWGLEIPRTNSQFYVYHPKKIP